MAFRNLVVINGKEVELKDLPEEERRRLSLWWNRRAAEAIGYKEVVKTAK